MTDDQVTQRILPGPMSRQKTAYDEQNLRKL